MYQLISRRFLIYICFTSIMVSGCKKLLNIDPPLSSLTTDEMFSNNKQAEFAIAGIYSKLINGSSTLNFTGGVAESNFAAGLITLTAGLSADELVIPSNAVERDLAVVRNKIVPTTVSRVISIWNTAYKNIYDVNAIIEALQNSTSPDLTENMKNQLMGEALALRAFTYFYLVNLYGDLPLSTTTDTKTNMTLPRSSVDKVYAVIEADLLKAERLLSIDFSFAGNEKIRVNKWFATAMLARVYLFTGRYSEAQDYASQVINQKHLFQLEDDISKVFLKNSKESIFQLRQANEAEFASLATPEGLRLLYNSNAIPVVAPAYSLNENLTNSFETGDKRKTTWTAFSNTYRTVAKYKNSPGTEYYTVIRLAELHLIRAEAIVLGNASNTDLAVEDLNTLRKRADLAELSESISKPALITAIAQERRTELFAEWGHRWLDLKRTGKAAEVLSEVSYKQPWWGEFQLLYPIPLIDLQNNGQLNQNPLYENY